jgi:transcriptional regulator with XRE-family HTH domain
MTSQELRNAREAANMTQPKLADAAGVSRSLIAFAERGLELGDESAAKIEKALKRALTAAAKRADTMKAVLSA